MNSCMNRRVNLIDLSQFIFADPHKNFESAACVKQIEIEVIGKGDSNQLVRLEF
jgi:hypothetical protein